jgi:hypothetical protein
MPAAAASNGLLHLLRLLPTSAVMGQVMLQGAHLEQQVAVDEPGGVAKANQLHQLRQLHEKQQQSTDSLLRVSTVQERARDEVCLPAEARAQQATAV